MLLKEVIEGYLHLCDKKGLPVREQGTLRVSLKVSRIMLFYVELLIVETGRLAE
ncbi:hypothetical protein [Pradoshia sp. D12]|uniref:hypothetical protein n=1 Tax=Pradoshia sp. D12 TaxID=2651284 RepID=UPI00178C20C4|nr:hypothetical protein [Pradoshia sp. D12]